MNVEDYLDPDLPQHIEFKQNLEQSSSSTKTGSKIKNLLEDLLDKAYQANEVMNSIIVAKQAGFQKLPSDLTKQGVKLANVLHGHSECSVILN